MKKFISVILLLCAVLGALTACSGKTATERYHRYPSTTPSLKK